MTAKRLDFVVGRGNYNTTPSGLACPIHQFGSAEDDLTDIVVAGYFNDILADEIAENNVRKGDMIAAVDNDLESQLYRISAVTPNVTIETLP